MGKLTSTSFSVSDEGIQRSALLLKTKGFCVHGDFTRDNKSETVFADPQELASGDTDPLAARGLGKEPLGTGRSTCTTLECAEMIPLLFPPLCSLSPAAGAGDGRAERPPQQLLRRAMGHRPLDPHSLPGAWPGRGTYPDTEQLPSGRGRARSPGARGRPPAPRPSRGRARREEPAARFRLAPAAAAEPRAAGAGLSDRVGERGRGGLRGDPGHRRP